MVKGGCRGYSGESATMVARAQTHTHVCTKCVCVCMCLRGWVGEGSSNASYSLLIGLRVTLVP